MNETPNKENSTANSANEKTTKIDPSMPAEKNGWHPEEKEHKAAERSHWIHQKRTNNFTLGISLFALIGAIASGIISTCSLNTSIEAAKEYRRQANAAEIANQAAREAQRPFVLITGLQIHRQDLEGGVLPYIGFRIVAQNSGNTATKDMHYVAIGPTRTPPITDPDTMYERPPDGFEKWKITLPPHFIGPLSFGLASIPLSSFKQAVNEHAWYFVYGAAHYRDALQEKSKEHVTRFCFQIGTSSADTNQITYIPCGGWNCADDDCNEDAQRYQEWLKQLTLRPPAPQQQ